MTWESKWERLEGVPFPLAYLVQVCTNQEETMDSEKIIPPQGGTGAVPFPTSRPSTFSDAFENRLRLYREHLEINDPEYLSVAGKFLRELIACHNAARAIAEGLARRVAEQSELLSRRAEKFPLPSSAATEAALADLTSELMSYLASRGLAPAVDSWAELNGRLRVWATNKRVRMGMEVSTPERNP